MLERFAVRYLTIKITTTMKKIFSLFIICCFTLSVFAQRGERMKAFKAAYFTEKLELTTEEARLFWPIHDEFEAERKKLRDQFERPDKRIENLSDEELEKLLNQRFDLEEQELQLKRKYFQKFKTALPIRKVARLHRVEREFKKEVLEMIRERRAARRGKD